MIIENFIESILQSFSLSDEDMKDQKQVKADDFLASQLRGLEKGQASEKSARLIKVLKAQPRGPGTASGLVVLRGVRQDEATRVREIQEGREWQRGPPTQVNAISPDCPLAMTRVVPKSPPIEFLVKCHFTAFAIGTHKVSAYIGPDRFPSEMLISPNFQLGIMRVVPTLIPMPFLVK